MDDPHLTELRELRGRLTDLETRVEKGRRITAGLVLALVGLLGGLSLPWAITTRSADADTPGVDGGITTWLDGWLFFARAVEDLSAGWPFLLAAVVSMVLAVLVAVLLRSLSHGVATAVVVLGGLGVVGLTLMWVASLSAVLSSAGSGLLVAAVASLVAALSAWSVRRLPSLATPPPPPPATSSAPDGGA